MLCIIDGAFCGCPKLEKVVFASKYKKLTVGVNAFSGNNIVNDYADEIGKDLKITLLVPKGSLQEYKKAITEVYSVREEDRVWEEDGKYVTIKKQ